MKKAVLLLAGFLALLPAIVGNGASKVFAQAALSEAKKDAKILVAYFSRADENYGVGFVEKGAGEARRPNSGLERIRYYLFRLSELVGKCGEICRWQCTPFWKAVILQAKRLFRFAPMPEAAFQIR